MRKHNGTQLYGIQKILTILKMGRNKELRKLPIKQKLAMKYVSNVQMPRTSPKVRKYST